MVIQPKNMPTIEEQRNKAIAEQIRKMAGMEPEETSQSNTVIPKQKTASKPKFGVP